MSWSDKTDEHSVRSTRVKILVAGCDDAVRDVVLAAGFDVLTAQTAGECVKLAHDGNFGLILLEAQLPDASGIEVCRTLRSDPITSPVTIVVVSENAKDRAAAFDSGADAFLARPFENCELVAQIKALMRIRVISPLGREEQELREREQREREQREFLECLITNAGSCIAVVQGLDVRYTRINPAYQAVRPGVQIVGRTYREVFPEAAALAGVEDRIRQVLVTGEPWMPNAYKAPLPDKPDAAWQGHIVRLPFREGEEPSALIVVWDITERVRAEEALKEAKERLQSILSSIREGYYCLNAQWEFVTVNPATERHFARSEKELLGKNIWEVLGSSASEALRPSFEQAMAGGRSIRFETESRLRPGYWAEVHLCPRNEFLDVYFTDISLRKRAEQELRESEERLHLAQEAAALGVYDDNFVTGVLAWDDRVRELWGISKSAIVNYKTFMSGLHPEDRAPTQALVNRALDPAGDGVYRAEYRVINARDGQIRWIAALGRVAFENGRAVRLVGTLQDVTDRKQAEEARIVLSKLESTGILAGGIAHDFNNLLSSMVLNVDLAESNMYAGRDFRIYLEGARNAIAAARDLTKQLITFAKGGMPVRKVVQLKALIEQSSALALSGANVHAEIDADVDLHWTNVDDGQIGQVIRNLVLNARDAMPHGGAVHVFARNLTLPAKGAPHLPAGKYVRVTLVDQGEGIAPEVLPKIFDPYFSTKQRGADKGMGLGLTICHTIINKHGGAITVESKPGVGSMFEFYLPACERPGLTQARKDTQAKSPPTGKRILVMDDEAYMRLAIEVALETSGFEVETANNGQEAIEIYTKALRQNRRFDAVMLDLTVRGGMGGEETIKKLLEFDPGVKGIVMTGYSESPVVMAPQKYGFRLGMEKSFDLDQLIESVTRVLEEPGV